MAAPQTAVSRPSQGLSLEVGDLAPSFRLMAKGGEAIDPASDLVAGKPLLVLFCPKGAALPADAAALGHAVAGAEGRNVIAVSAGTDDAPTPDGFELAVDPH